MWSKHLHTFLEFSIFLDVCAAEPAHQLDLQHIHTRITHIFCYQQWTLPKYSFAYVILFFGVPLSIVSFLVVEYWRVDRDSSVAILKFPPTGNGWNRTGSRPNRVIRWETCHPTSSILPRRPLPHKKINFRHLRIRKWTTTAICEFADDTKYIPIKIILFQ
jgi:hypothetical protein